MFTASLFWAFGILLLASHITILQQSLVSIAVFYSGFVLLNTFRLKRKCSLFFFLTPYNCEVVCYLEPKFTDSAFFFCRVSSFVNLTLFTSDRILTN